MTAQAWSLTEGLASPNNPNCGQDNGMPTPYDSGVNMLATGSTCGYQVQLNNLNANAAYTVKVLTQDAMTLAATVAVSASTLFSLF